MEYTFLISITIIRKKKKNSRVHRSIRITQTQIANEIIIAIQVRKKLLQIIDITKITINQILV